MILTRKNNKNGDELSILGFGCMRFPTKGSSIDEERSITLIRDAVDKGVNYFDTAYFYNNGRSESLLGEALLGGYRQKVKIATKLPPFMVSKLDSAKKILETQLSKLKTEYIDYYLLHMLTDKATFDRMVKIGVIEWLEQLKKEGTIRNIGFSFHGGKADFEQLITAYPWDFCQIQYNYLDENNQATKSGLQLAHSLGIPVIIMEPLRGGKLVNNLPEQVIKEFNTYDPDRSPAEWGLRWIWNHPEVTVILSGMSDEVQLTENVRIAQDAKANALSDAELKIFDRVKAILLDKTKVPCTACGYCMPCPAGVNIPGCFAAYNDKYLLNDKRNRFKYLQTLGVLSKQPAFASLCKECGKCEKHCPQNIQIRQELKKVKKEMEPLGFRMAVGIARKFMKIK
jgi:predicted aldo/keto reductase-like oxidoreductase